MHVREHALFAREGLDLHLDVPITVAEAVRGAKVRVPTLQGAVTVRVPPGSQTGQKLRLRGKGIARQGKPTGDLYAHLQVQVPQSADPEALSEALDALERAYQEHPRSQWGASAPRTRPHELSGSPIPSRSMKHSREEAPLAAPPRGVYDTEGGVLARR